MTSKQMQNVLISTLSEFQEESNGVYSFDALMTPGNLLINSSNEYVYIGDKNRCCAFTHPDDVSCDFDIKKVIVSKSNTSFFTDDNKLTLYRRDGDDIVLVRTLDSTYDSMSKIPVKQVKFGTHAFKCSSLTSMSFPSSQKVVPEECFYSSHRLKRVAITSHLDSIESGAFIDCTSVESVILKSCNTIGDQAFMDCCNLKTVELPDDLSSLGMSVFKNCSSLVNIDLSNTSIDTIQQGAFNNCSALKRIDFPKSLNSIDERSFVGCLSLSALVFTNLDHCVNTKVCFDAGLPEGFKIVVPDQLLDAWVEQEYECNRDNIVCASNFAVQVNLENESII